MKIGIKIRKDNLDLISRYEKLYDFFEIYIDPEFPLEKLKKINSRKILTIHLAHQEDKFEPSLKSEHALCKKILERAIKSADILDSPWIIVHPSHNLAQESKQNMLDFFDKNWDRRMIFENCMFFQNGTQLPYLFSLPEEMKELLDRYQTKMCLDFGHTICSSNYLGVNLEELIDKFIKLDPMCYHVSGIDSLSVRDTHLHLYEVNNKMDYLKKIRKDKFITLETPVKDFGDEKLQMKDLAFIRNLMS